MLSILIIPVSFPPVFISSLFASLFIILFIFTEYYRMNVSAGQTH